MFTLTEIWDFSPTFRLWREKYLLKSCNNNRVRYLLKGNEGHQDDGFN